MKAIPELVEKKEDCCGCAACMAGCPVKAIRMEEDEEGFLYPKIQEEICIRCGKCIKICPVRKNRQMVRADVPGVKKDVGIITLYYGNNNYGGLAQSYALYKVVTMLGYDAELISYKRTMQAAAPVRASLLEKIRRNSVSGLCDRYYRKGKEKIERKLEQDCADQLKKRGEMLEIFREWIPHSPVYTKETIGQCRDRYETFISGSDQIWKPGVADEAFLFSFLDDQPDKHIISYASSVAVQEFPDGYLDFMEKELKKYSCISVRESVTAEAFSKALNREVVRVTDPTLLLSREEWEKVTAERQIKESYIFCYLLGNDKKQRKKAEQIAREQKKLLVTIPHIKNGNSFHFRLEDKDFGDCQLFAVGMEEFFSLIKYADMVITDSFHATVFSTVFERPFWVFERTAKTKKTEMNSRIHELTQMLGLERRILKSELPEQIEEPVDFVMARKKIQPEIERSRQFLENALSAFKESLDNN